LGWTDHSEYLDSRIVKGMARTALRIVVTLFAVTCCLIGVAHLAVGPAAIPGSIPVNNTMDSEDRFYATLFLSFGIAMFWCGRDLVARRRAFGFLLLTFFMGGNARLLSWAMVGPPNNLFIFLGIVELLMPPLLWFWNERCR
jgi:Domain of unknown function (DUF4345)